MTERATPAGRRRGALGAASAGDDGRWRRQRSARAPILLIENLTLADELLNALCGSRHGRRDLRPRAR